MGYGRSAINICGSSFINTGYGNYPGYGKSLGYGHNPGYGS